MSVRYCCSAKSVNALSFAALGCLAEVIFLHNNNYNIILAVGGSAGLPTANRLFIRNYNKLKNLSGCGRFR